MNAMPPISSLLQHASGCTECISIDLADSSNTWMEPVHGTGGGTGESSTFGLRTPNSHKG